MDELELTQKFPGPENSEFSLIPLLTFTYTHKTVMTFIEHRFKGKTRYKLDHKLKG